MNYYLLKTDQQRNNMNIKELQDKIYAKIDELPTLPVVVPRLLELMEDKKSSVADITAIISNDPALVSKIMKVANSAYYGFPQQIADLDRAVPLLGFNMVRSLALSLGVINSLPGAQKSEYFSQEGLWLHSLAVATIMKEMGGFLGQQQAGYQFIIGLLHDIGKLVMDQFFYDKFQEVLNIANSGEAQKLHAAEKAIIGIDHNEISAMLLNRWKFPPEIINPIMDMHREKPNPETSHFDRALLRVANSIAQELNFGLEGNSIPNPVHDGDVAILMISMEKLENIRNKIEEKREGITAFLNALF